MIRDFRSYANGAHIHTDICVIGAGAAGIALAREFIGSSTRVLLLDSGGFELEGSTDLLSQGESIGLTHHGLHEGRRRSFGGTTKLWAGQCIRLDDIDFEARSWVSYSGWPITKADLDAFYARAEALFGIPEQLYDERVWQKFNIRPPNLDGSKLGYKFAVFSPRLDLGKFYRDEFKNSTNVQVLLHANATKIHTNKYASAVEYLDIRTLEGKTGRVTAKAFVLCGGGIENARLLLLSNQTEASGLGNRHDVVGRFFQEHPAAYSAVLQADTLNTLQEPYGLLYKGGFRYFPKIPLSVEVQRAQQVLNGVADLAYEYDADSGIGAAKEIYRSLKKRRWPKELTRRAGLVIKDLDQILAVVYRRYGQGKLGLAQKEIFAPKRARELTASPPSLAWLRIHLEQAPNPLSRVSLSRERDALGLNQARVDWRLTDLERRTAETITKTLDAEFRRLELARLRVEDWLVNSSEDWVQSFSESYHHMGTTRMANDPKKGVVNSDCQVHGVAGLYIGGSSVFPTSGYAYPTLTIVALALRLADHLKATVPGER
jgi:choline dehydrogenase-like flavoprotein